METWSRDELWKAVATERSRLADDLAGLAPADWDRPSLCGEWTVREVVAHLTAAASVGRLRWLTSVLAARFDFDLHNRRRLAEHLGTGAADTLARFQAVRTRTTAASGHTPAWLGEVVVHGQDVRHPLGLATRPDPAAVAQVAQFFAGRDFTVPSKTLVAGLRLEATDSDLAVGDGPEVVGSTLALTMAMAGRPAFLPELTGAGLPVLAERLGAGPPGDGPTTG
nr:maleylpyruvate isomerase family mycothiol-dependent enzyme [Serinicoccus kebangsaanensis]